MNKRDILDTAALDEGIDPLDLVGGRLASGAFTAALWAKFCKPDWMLVNTSLQGAQAIPDQILVRDLLTVVGNMARHSPDPVYHLNFVLAGVPMYRGVVDVGMQTAPNLYSALELLNFYADDRPGVYRHVLTDNGKVTRLELVPMTKLGDARRLMLEAPLLVYARLAARFVGRPVNEAIVEFRHGPPPYVDRLRESFDCELRFNAATDSIQFPSAVAASPNMSHDPDLWRTTVLRCQEEEARGRAKSMVNQLEAIVAKLMFENGHVPRLDEAATSIGVSSRTLIRRLRTDDLTYQDIVDSILQSRSKQLLADTSLTIARVADEIGFPDSSGFHRRFKRWFGMTPSQYREQGLDVNQAAKGND